MMRRTDRRTDSAAAAIVVAAAVANGSWRYTYLSPFRMLAAAFYRGRDLMGTVIGQYRPAARLPNRWLSRIVRFVVTLCALLPAGSAEGQREVGATRIDNILLDNAINEFFRGDSDIRDRADQIGHEVAREIFENGDDNSERNAMDKSPLLGSRPFEDTWADVTRDALGRATILSLDALKLAPTVERSTDEFGFARSRIDLRTSTDFPPEWWSMPGRTRLSAEEVGNGIWSIMWREQIIKQTGAKRLKDFETQDDLRNYLASIGVKDALTVAASFDHTAKVSLVNFPSRRNMLRIFGGDARPDGRWYFCCLDDETGWTDARGLALPAANMQRDLARVELPAGTRAFVGPTADLFEGNRLSKGGNVQIFVPHVDQFSYEHYKLSSLRDPSRIKVVFDKQRVLMFSREEKSDLWIPKSRGR